MELDYSTFEKLIPAVLSIIILISIFLKKRDQIGKTWSGPYSAKVTIKDVQLVCHHCKHDKFSKREGLIATSFVILFHFGFWNRSGACFVCKNCGYTHWFIDPKEKAEMEFKNNEE